jgi:hypothetical protein
MSIEVAIRSLLLNAQPVTAVVQDRVYFLTRPQNERRACCILTLAGLTRPHTMDGAAGYATGTVRVDVLASTYKDVKELAAAVVATLDGYSGTEEGVNVGYLECESEEDIEQAPLEGQAVPQQYGISIEVSFLYTE